MVFVTKANTHSSLLLPVREVVLQSLLQNNVEEQAGQKITPLGHLFDLEHVARLMHPCSIPQDSRAFQIDLCVMESLNFPCLVF